MRSKLYFLPLLLAIVAACGCPEGITQPPMPTPIPTTIPKTRTPSPIPQTLTPTQHPPTRTLIPRTPTPTPTPIPPAPTPNPWAVPDVLGTWKGSLVEGNHSCLVTVKISGRGTETVVGGSIEAQCFRALFEAQWVGAPNWRLEGKAHPEYDADYGYYGDCDLYDVSLSGHLENHGAWFIASTGPFSCPSHPLDGTQLRVVRAAH